VVVIQSALLWLTPVPEIAVTVTGASQCPTPAAVTDRVATLLPRGSAAMGSAQLADAGTALVIVMRNQLGAVTERRLPRAGETCDELAAAAATVVATWLSDLHPNFPAQFVVDDNHRPGWGLTGALGLSGSVAPGAGAAGWAGGIWASAGVFPTQRLGARLGLTGETERRFPVGAGQALSRRLSAALGPVLRADLGQDALVEVTAAAVAARFTLRGQGFAQGLDSESVDWGASAGVLLTTRHAFGPFVALEAITWPLARTALELQTGARAQLPRFGAGLVLGLRAQRL
jgi:hypothetical protein